jgi:molybdopterin molybdotransferase
MMMITQAHTILSNIITTIGLPSPKHIELCPCDDALGRVLAEDIMAPFESPRFTNSSMDGFAIQADDITPLHAVYLCIGESSAGNGFTDHVPQGCCVRISTGAPLPMTTNTIIPIEDIDILSDTTISVRYPQAVKQGQYVRLQGSEFDTHTLLLPVGTYCSPSVLALCASIGRTQIQVYRQPRVGIVTTGNELLPAGTALSSPHQIYDSNTPLLRHAIRQSGGIPVMALHTQDSLDTICHAIETLCAHSDLVITSGGASVGVHDLVRRAAQTCGFTEHFFGVRQKPGKPMFCYTRDTSVLIGLPGNPASVMMCYMEYVHGFIGSLHGFVRPQASAIAVLARPISAPHDRDEFVRVCVYEKQGILYAEPLLQQQSFMITSLTLAQGFMRCSAGVFYHIGESVMVRYWLT